MASRDLVADALAVVGLLRHWHTTGELIEALGSEQRAVYRTIERLRAIGVPIVERRLRRQGGPIEMRVPAWWTGAELVTRRRR